MIASTAPGFVSCLQHVAAYRRRARSRLAAKRWREENAARRGDWLWRPLTAMLAATALGVSACSPGADVQRYDAPKEQAADPAAEAHAAIGGVPASGGGSAAAEPGLTYQVPEGWTELPASGMRKAAFRVEDAGQQVEITVIDLAAAAGDLLPNINRWRQQIQLDELAEADLDDAVTEISVGGVAGHYVELLGPAREDKREAILGVVAVHDDKAWFFKMWGNADLALRESERFQGFVKSVQFGGEGAGRDN